MKHLPICLSLIASLVSVSNVARADVLVELFTSEACDVCEKSDKLLNQLSDKEGVVTLSFHVDYWDYLGEPDLFADPLFGARQIGYIQDDAKKEVHTPELVVAGEANFTASDSEEIELIIDEDEQHVVEVIDAYDEGDEVVVTLTPHPELDKTYNIVLASLYTQDEIDNLKTKDDSEHLSPNSLVKEISSLGEWDNKSEQEFSFLPDVDRRYVVFLQAPNFGEVIDAIRIDPY